MNNLVRIQLQTDAVQQVRLLQLQAAFAEVCNVLAPMAQAHACWNRVALHHMAYRTLRQQFPSLGSQMVCNAIYSVSRACRIVYQHPGSPFNLQRLRGKPLPRLIFLPESPVYFDRHTLSLKDRQVSMYTLDGRMRFALALSEADEARFRAEKLREIVLTRSASVFTLTFSFADLETPQTEPSDSETDAARSLVSTDPANLPQYVVIADTPTPPLAVPLARGQPLANRLS